MNIQISTHYTRIYVFVVSQSLKPLSTEATICTTMHQNGSVAKHMPLQRAVGLNLRSLATGYNFIGMYILPRELHWFGI